MDRPSGAQVGASLFTEFFISLRIPAPSGYIVKISKRPLKRPQGPKRGSMGSRLNGRETRPPITQDRKNIGNDLPVPGKIYDHEMQLKGSYL